LAALLPRNRCEKDLGTASGLDSCVTRKWLVSLFLSHIFEPLNRDKDGVDGSGRARYIYLYSICTYTYTQYVSLFLFSCEIMNHRRELQYLNVISLCFVQRTELVSITHSPTPNHFGNQMRFLYSRQQVSITVCTHLY
jgi:hypothetical protein